jgi:hypothetical protein
LLCVDAGFGEPLQMIFPQFGGHDVEDFVPPLESLFEE